MNRRWFAIVLGLSAGCSWLVAPEDVKPKCQIPALGEDRGEDGGNQRLDPCPGDTYCTKAGFCEVTVCAEDEVCFNGIDDDCDHVVDETNDVVDVCDKQDNNCDGNIDEGNDSDGDGVTWCGDLTNPASVDCSEDERDVFPGNTEKCDNLDNDCDRDTDEGTLCDPGHSCINGQCVDGNPKGCGAGGVLCAPNTRCVDGKCVPTACVVECGPREICDTKTYTCIPVPQQPNGGACTSDEDCLSGWCIESAALSFPAMPAGVCGSPCCGDADCTVPGEACYTSGTGARSCLPKTRGSLLKPLCSDRAPCAAGETCAPGRALAPSLSRMEVVSSICRKPNSATLGAVGAECDPFMDDSNQCASRLCNFVGGFTLRPGRCSKPCVLDADCKGFQPPTPEQRTICSYVDLQDYSQTANNFLGICTLTREIPTTGARDAGGDCKVNTDCKVGVCVGATPTKQGKCAPTCCNNTDCTGLTRCKPVRRGERFEMRCIAQQ